LLSKITGELNKLLFFELGNSDEVVAVLPSRIDKGLLNRLPGLSLHWVIAIVKRAF
jgi:hypothetical protein